MKILAYFSKEYVFVKLRTRQKNPKNLPNDGYMDNSWRIYSTFQVFASLILK